MSLFPCRSCFIHLLALGRERIVEIFVDTADFHKVCNFSLLVVEEDDPTRRLSDRRLLLQRPHCRRDEVAIRLDLAESHCDDDLRARD